VKIDAQIRIAGMEALINALRLVEAESFMISASRDRLNHAAWRRYGLPGVSLSVLVQSANRHAEQQFSL
jgi:hypothetical protein